MQAKLDKLAADDPKRSDLIAEHQRGPWLKTAARRVKQIQAVTHSLKAIHPDARGTNIHVIPSDLPTLPELGTHALGTSVAADVVGNAAALDVYKLLKIEVAGRTLLQALIANEAHALNALDDDPAEARTLRDALISLTAERTGVASSHALAKQLDWLVGDDASDDAQYHLIAPLYATSLVQFVYDEVQDARFGEANKLARQSRRNGLPHDGVYREYRDLAVQKLGGNKPQNVSQLNSERRGNNYLLSSLPPVVRQNPRNYLPVNAQSAFDRAFGARPLVRSAVRELKAFLSGDPPKNLHTRNRRNGLVDAIVEELVVYGYELRDQPAGWTRGPAFEDLAEPEQLWLDPLRAELSDETEFASRWQYMDWPVQVGERFGKWLNGQLRAALPELGRVEARAWRKLLQGDMTWLQQVNRMRKRLGAPTYIPLSKPHDELMRMREGR
ncbi:type I-F CRISPR-associated protein Csy1 [Burkholderia sp. SFA1]|nr:type I-F CRISPR-associated protein Csy1 [Burkholderia sp. SFA1]